MIPLDLDFSIIKPDLGLIIWTLFVVSITFILPIATFILGYFLGKRNAKKEFQNNNS